MWKLCRIVIALLLALQFQLFLTEPHPAKAGGNTADVVITFTPEAVGAPVGFTVTYIDSHNVDIDWTKGHDAVSTEIRASIGETPTSRTEGYLVYYGVNETFTDNVPDFDLFLGTVGYAAWCEDALGNWSALASDDIGGDLLEDIANELSAMSVVFGTLSDVGVSFIILLVVVAINALAFLVKDTKGQDNVFLYILAVPTDMVYGLSTASAETVNSPMWVGAVIIGIIGLYCLFKVVAMGLGEFKARRK